MPGTAVSVGILTHNRPGTLAQAIASVRAQAIIDYEIIVVSNGEGDDARRASHDIATAHGGRYFALPEANVSAARNLAIKSVKGEWIAVLDDHDLWLPTKLARQVETARRTGADLITTDYVQFYQDGTAVIRRARLLDGRSYPQGKSFMAIGELPSSAIMRKSVIQKLGGFAPRQRFGEGLDMWRRLSWGHKNHQLEEVLVRYPNTMQRECSRYFYDLRLYLKIWLDSSCHLRERILLCGWYVAPRVIGILSPDWLRRFLHWLDPRRRWLEFRRWLTPRARLNELRYRFSPPARMRSLATRLDIMEFWERLGDM
jgi:glycosyltransferase involved in cell wall biosynthesis